MPRATLVIDCDISALRRTMGEIPGITARAQGVMTGAARRGGRERVGIDRTFEREHESIHMQLARARERQAKEATAKEAAEARKQVQNDAQFARERDNIHARLARAREARAAAETRREAAEGRRRVAGDAQFARERDNIHARMVAAQTQRERQATRERRALGQTVGSQAASTVGAIVTGAHGEIQNTRQTVAERTSAINTSLVQRGTSREENAEDNAAIQARLSESRTGVAPEVAIQAIANAQSFASALGGDTRAQRVANRNATLGDVEFAGAIDPQNVGGIVNLGAVLRRRVSDDALRRRILRGAVGTSFEGSVETDDMIGSALPGLLQAISSGTANAGSDAERERLTAEISQDFFAQIQSQAAGGRATGVSANRTNTVRTALSNDTRQDRLGLALAERARTGSDEQRAAFAAAFTKDAGGAYHMNASLRDTPSNAARFFGTMFNNSDEELRNFMGVNGGGGARQLLNIPDVAAISSYFGMTTNRQGQAVREYDHVTELKGATVTDAQAETMRRTRAEEDRTRLIREQEARLRAGNSTGLFGRVSNAVRTFASENPMLALLGGSVAAPVLGAGAKAAGGAVVGVLGGGPAALMAALAVGGTALGLYGSAETARTGKDAQGREVSTGERIARGAAAAGSSIVFFGPLISAIQDLPRQFAEAIRENPPTITPHDAAQVVSGAVPGRRRAGEQ